VLRAGIGHEILLGLLRGSQMIDAKAIERFMAAPWLAEVDPDTKRAISGVLVEARASTGATLLEQGQPNDHLTFLIAGTAEIVRTFASGRREIITDLTAPAVFGTTSFFQPKPPTVTVKATSDVWILSLYHPAHEALRAANPRAAEALALAVVRALSERFDLIDKLFAEFTMQHSDEPARKSEWATFRARLFEERGI
jgi:CRP/FNR family transcriptional regulator, cyclic AMP receptor protein